MEALALISPGIIMILGVFLIVVGIMALLMPFFVFHIREEMIKLNKNVEKLIAIASSINSNSTAPFVLPGNNPPKPDEIIKCYMCKKRFEAADLVQYKTHYLCHKCFDKAMKWKPKAKTV